MVAQARKNYGTDARQRTQDHTGQAPFKIGRTSKVGFETFSLPALISCPGATESCRSICYAQKGRMGLGTALNAYSRNMARFLRYEKADDLQGAISELLGLLWNKRHIRLHGSGDFHSQFAVDVWTGVFRECTWLVGFAYTRSFGLDLSQLAALPNFTLHLSADADNIVEALALAAQIGAKPAYMGEGLGSGFVCPQQLGSKESCAECRLCFDPRVKKSVIFKLH